MAGNVLDFPFPSGPFQFIFTSSFRSINTHNDLFEKKKKGQLFLLIISNASSSNKIFIFTDVVHLWFFTDSFDK